MADEKASPASEAAPGLENVEWRLADFADAIAAEVDRAQDTLAFKSYARGLSVSLKGLDLDLAVDIRVDRDGQVFFRTVEAGKPCSTVLKLDFEETLQAQVEEVRTPIDPGGGQPVETLPGITQAEIDALAVLSITTVEGLLLYSRTPAMLRELARKSGIAEPRLRMWLGFPFLARITPSRGAAGQQAVIEGGNLGEQDAEDTILFPGTTAEILSWSASRIVVKVPAGAMSGAVYARIDGALTNVLQWEAVPETPPLLKLTNVTPARGTAGSSHGVTLEGSGFGEGVTLSFGPAIRVEQVVVASPTRITARLTLEVGAAPGARDVTVAIGSRNAALAAGYTVEARPPLEDFSITSLSPSQGTAGTTLKMDLSGKGFQPGVFITFGSQVQVTGLLEVTPTKLRLQLFLPATAVGRHSVTVTNPDKRTITKTDAFEVIAPTTKAAARQNSRKKP